MRHLRLLLIAFATTCVMALGAFAFVNPSDGGDDDIVIKGGSLEIQCGKNHYNDCLGPNDNTGKYKHKQGGKHITKIVIKRADGVVAFDSDITPVSSKPEIYITYK
jgi:hypothetical protein